MIPFRDRNPSGSVPVVTIGLILVNVAVFLVELGQGENLKGFIDNYGLTPTRIFAGVTGRAPERDGLAGPPPRHTIPAALTLFTSMFLHGGWMHLIGNMWYLWIFGDNVEGRMGHFRYLVFYLLCGLGAGTAQLLSNPAASLPTIGASGAVAGVLGAYLLAFPWARVQTLVFLFIFITVVEMPAMVLLGFWFLIQFFSGMGSLRMRHAGGVAWWAHVGGFVLGIFLLRVFQKPRGQRRGYAYVD